MITHASPRLGRGLWFRGIALLLVLSLGVDQASAFPAFPLQTISPANYESSAFGEQAFALRACGVLQSFGRRSAAFARRVLSSPFRTPPGRWLVKWFKWPTGRYWGDLKLLHTREGIGWALMGIAVIMVASSFLCTYGPNLTKQFVNLHPLHLSDPTPLHAMIRMTVGVVITGLGIFLDIYVGQLFKLIAARVDRKGMSLGAWVFLHPNNPQRLDPRHVDPQFPSRSYSGFNEGSKSAIEFPMRLLHVAAFWGMGIYQLVKLQPIAALFMAYNVWPLVRLLFRFWKPLKQEWDIYWEYDGRTRADHHSFYKAMLPKVLAGGLSQAIRELLDEDYVRLEQKKIELAKLDMAFDIRRGARINLFMGTVVFLVEYWMRYLWGGDAVWFTAHPWLHYFIGNLDLGTITAVTGLLAALTGSTAGGADLLRQLFSSKAALEYLLKRLPEDPLPDVSASSQVPTGEIGCKIENDPIMHDVDFHVSPGEIIQVTGLNGAGKTHLFWYLAGIRTSPTAHISWSLRDADGTIAWSKTLPESARRHFYFVAAKPEILNDRPLWQSLTLGLEPMDFETASARLDHYGARSLIKWMKNKTDNTGASSGQIMRLEIARALLGDAKILFFDEPLANLDEQGVEALVQLLPVLKSNGITVFFTGHLQELQKAIKPDKTIHLIARKTDDQDNADETIGLRIPIPVHANGHRNGYSGNGWHPKPSIVHPRVASSS